MKEFKDTYSKNTVSTRNITFHYYGFNVHPIIIHLAVMKNEGILTLSTGKVSMSFAVMWKEFKGWFLKMLLLLQQAFDIHWPQSLSKTPDFQNCYIYWYPTSMFYMKSCTTWFYNRAQHGSTTEHNTRSSQTSQYMHDIWALIFFWLAAQVNPLLNWQHNILWHQQNYWVESVKLNSS